MLSRTPRRRRCRRLVRGGRPSVVFVGPAPPLSRTARAGLRSMTHAHHTTTVCRASPPPPTARRATRRSSAPQSRPTAAAEIRTGVHWRPGPASAYRPLTPGTGAHTPPTDVTAPTRSTG
jgi:hypothetical protein